MENNFGELQIVYIPVDQLKPYERNARTFQPITNQECELKKL